MKSLCVAIAACVLLSGCGGKKRLQLPATARLGATQTGVASWYGNPYHGRRAADGEIYDMEKMTAAHRTLPFGTWLRVANLENGKSVEVRIIDRGPFVVGRIIDLSHAAAVSLAMIGPGTAKVKLTVIAAPQPATEEPPATQIASAEFAVQVGAFSDRSNAERVRTQMESLYGAAKIVLRDGQPPQWRVLVGREATEEGAEALAQRIRSDPQAQAAGAFVVRLDTGNAADSI